MSASGTPVSTTRGHEEARAVVWAHTQAVIERVIGGQ